MSENLKDTQCHICKKIFSTKSNLRAHFKNKTPCNQRQPVNTRCDRCLKVFSSSSRLKYHINKKTQCINISGDINTNNNNTNNNNNNNTNNNNNNNNNNNINNNITNNIVIGNINKINNDINKINSNINKISKVITSNNKIITSYNSDDDNDDNDYKINNIGDDAIINNTMINYGLIYLLQSEELFNTNRYKFGYSSKNNLTRIKSYGFKVEIYLTYSSKNAKQLEKYIIDVLSKKYKKIKNEIFITLNIDEMINDIMCNCLLFNNNSIII